MAASFSGAGSSSSASIVVIAVWMMSMNEQGLAEKLAQAALRGWFGDAEGFRSMKSRNMRKAIREVQKVLSAVPFTTLKEQ